MTIQNQVYKCAICGNIVESLHGGAGELSCCNQAMNPMAENTVDAAVEKHVPVISQAGEKVQVVVGEVAHPMDEDHYIEWIEIIADGVVYRQNLKPGEEPKAVFMTSAVDIHARAYCNLHGLWKS